MMEAGMDPAGASLQRTLYHIAEDRARHEGIIHRGITCNACETKPIRGIRWRCVNCSDFDLCSDCEAANIHNRTHLFYKIRVPAPYMSLPRQEPVYPGRPHVMPSSINALHKRRLVEQTRKEAEEIEALWDQFTCLAATEWMSDPDQVGFAIDRRAFNHAFIPRYSSFTSVPNLVYDRIFAYFDTDNNGLIGFEEFIKGLDGLHSTDTCVKLRIAFNGYDIDGDGYISRKDVLRIFRAHFAIEREATRNYLNDSEEELSLRGLLETIRSSKPLGSAFTQQSRFSALPNRELPANKGQNGYYPEPIVDDIPDTMDRAAVIGWAHRYGHGMEGPGIDFLDAQDEAIRDRWARRQYYTDEEEGLTRPACADDNQFAELETQPDGEGERSSSSENERRRESRSSSRVRFEDDVNGDTRSNASSRPVGERWGGYDIPIPENEKELGKDVSYQIIQQAFNELLDPLFKKKESLAMDAFATRLERRLNPSPITSLYRNHYTTERAFNKTVLRIGTSRYAAYVVHIFNNNNLLLLFKRTEGVTRDDLVAEIKMHFALAEQEIAQRLKIQNDDRQYPEDELWNVKLWRTQMLDEFTDTIVTLLQGMLAVVKETYQDPTMPQFRPNSLVKTKLSELESKPTEDGEASSSVNQSEFGPFFITVGECVSPLPTSPQFEDVTPTSSPSILHLSVNAQFEALVFKHVPHQIVDVGEALRHEALDNKSSPLHFPYLAYLQHVDHAITEHNNGGMLDFEEFVACVEKGGLRFLESWMDFVSF
jgi:Ca2+-binding EF-hand superfamily protein